MRTIFSLLLFFLLTSCGSAPARQVINEEVFNQQLLSACEKIRKDGLLVKVDVLRVQHKKFLQGGEKIRLFLCQSRARTNSPLMKLPIWFDQARCRWLWSIYVPSANTCTLAMVRPGT